VNLRHLRRGFLAIAVGSSCLSLSIATTAINTEPSDPNLATGKQSSINDRVLSNSRGKSVFTEYCEGCHEATSRQPKLGSGLKGVFGKFPHKLPSGNIINGPEAIRRQIEEGGGRMPAMKDYLTRQEIRDVIGYLHTL